VAERELTEADAYAFAKNYSRGPGGTELAFSLVSLGPVRNDDEEALRGWGFRYFANCYLVWRNGYGGLQVNFVSIRSLQSHWSPWYRVPDLVLLAEVLDA
jgi:hypothetical protein